MQPSPMNNCLSQSHVPRVLLARWQVSEGRVVGDGVAETIGLKQTFIELVFGLGLDI